MESVFQYAQIQTTSSCPADCIYCPYSESWDAAHPTIMDDATFEMCLAKLATVSDFAWGKICPYLSNEPLTDPKIFDRIRRIREIFPFTKIEVNTNAILLTPERGEQLASALAGCRHIVHIHFSAINEETSQKAQHLPFQARYNNIDRFLTVAKNQNIFVELQGLYQSEDDSLKLFSAERWRRVMEKLSRSRAKRISAFKFHDRSGQIRRHALVNFKTHRDCDCGSGEIKPCRRTLNWISIDSTARLRLCCNDMRREVELPLLSDIPDLNTYMNGMEWKFIQDLSAGLEGGEDFICRRCRGNA